MTLEEIITHFRSGEPERYAEALQEAETVAAAPELPAGAPVDNWLIGIAGPYARAEQPTVADYGYTYSVFCHQDECDVDEHISRIAHTVNASVAGSPGR